MRIQQHLQRLPVDLPVRVLHAQEALEGSGNVLAIQQLDLLDEAIQPEPHGGIADPVRACQLLHGPGSQHEPFDERQVLFFERVDPPGRLSPGARSPIGGFLLLLKHAWIIFLLKFMSMLILLMWAAHIIGAVARTDWLPPQIEKDGKGFIRPDPLHARIVHEYLKEM